MRRSSFKRALSTRVKLARGFSLVEVAVVVAIGLILLSLGLTAINAQLGSASYSLTKKRSEAVKDALVSYLGANKRLPCPYAPVPGTAVTGIAPPQTVAVPPACPQVFGTVPFATLGLTRETAEDGWGNLLSYQIYSVPAAGSCPGVGVDWANSSCFGAGKIGGISVSDGIVTAPIPLATGVIAGVISHGANGLGAWVAAQGTRNASPLTCEELQNTGGSLSSPSCATAYVANSLYKGESQ
ncbi:MAG: prepilin-type N-terminal cleavage/methylation domain-containing protein, partial [Burkholderiales bacterium]